MAPKQKNPPVVDLAAEPLASFDLGNSHVKVKTASESSDFRSILGRLSRARRLGDLHTDLVFTFEDETLVFGDEVRDLCDGQPVAFTDRRRYTSGFYRKLAAAALWRAFRSIACDGVIYPKIVFSIPVMEYADGVADQVRDLLAGEYRIDGQNGVTLYAKLEKSNLKGLPEGAGEYFRAVAAGGGLGGLPVAVIDIGYYTTDLVLFNRGQYVTGAARSLPKGARFVAERVHNWLKRTYKYRGDVYAVDSALKDEVIQVGANCINLREEKGAGYADLLDEIITWYYSSIGDVTPGAVLLGGGGGEPAFKYVPEELKAEGWRVGGGRRGNVEGAFLYLEKAANRA
jgi:plasmid segregation protein ParM